MCSASNFGLIAHAAEEYCSHYKTFDIAAALGARALTAPV